MNDYKIPLRRKFLMYVEGGQPVPPPPPPIIKWLDVTRTDGLAESDRAAIAVFKATGLCENDDYMTAEEAAAVVQLPSFSNVTSLINWDWSSLSGMNNAHLRGLFSGCSNLMFTDLPSNLADRATDISTAFSGCRKLALTSLPAGFGSVATNMGNTFRSCTNLALTSLPAGFGSVATSMDYLFGGMYLDGYNYGCPNLALTSLPAGFGSVATSMVNMFMGCSKLALTSLPDGFGSVATNMVNMFSYQAGYTQPLTNLALTSLPDGFGSVATNMANMFMGCSKLALTSLPAGFGSRMGCNLSSCFSGCSKLALTTLPDGFGTNGNISQAFQNCSMISINSLPMSVGTATYYNSIFQNCSNLRGSFDLGNSNFGQNATVFSRAFFGTNITSFNGYFDLSSVNHDTAAAGTSFALEQFVPNTCTHVMFVANTLKYALVNSAANLTNIDTESLLSLAECLSSSASGKTWTVTSAQFDTLMSEMYSETLSYITYVMMKGWNVEAA